MQVIAYLTDGQRLEFVSRESAHEEDVLKEVRAGRLLLGKSLILGSGRSCTMLQTSAVARLDILTELPLSVPHSLDGRLDLIEDERRFLHLVENATATHGDGIAPGEEFDAYLTFRMSGKHHAHFSLHGVLQDQLQFFTNLRRIFDIPSLWFEHPRGGAIAINVLNLIGIASWPGFTQYPKGALLLSST